MQAGGASSTRFEYPTIRLHLERLTRHVEASLMVPGKGDEYLMLIQAIVDSSSGMTSISDALVKQIQAGSPGVKLTRLFEGQAQVGNSPGIW